MILEQVNCKKILVCYYDDTYVLREEWEQINKDLVELGVPPRAHVVFETKNDKTWVTAQWSADD